MDETKRLDDTETAEFIGTIIDILEDVLTERGATVPNEDREREIEDGTDPECLAIIYGNDYDVIGDTVCIMLESENLCEKPAMEPKRKESMIKKVMDSYLELIGKAEFPDRKGFDAKELEAMAEKIGDTFMNWGLFA